MNKLTCGQMNEQKGTEGRKTKRRHRSRWKIGGHLGVGKTTRRRGGDCMGVREDQGRDIQMDKENEEERRGEEKPRMTRVEQTKLRGRREQEARRQAGKESRTSKAERGTVRDCGGRGRGGCRKGGKRKDKSRGQRRRTWRSQNAERRTCGHQPERRRKRVASEGRKEARKDTRA